jgi:DNA gyrase subunit A
LAVFSNFGVAYVMKVGGVPATTGYGEPVQSLLNFKDGERIINAVLVAAAPPNGKPEAEVKPRQAELFGGAGPRGARQATELPPPASATVLLSGAEQGRPVDRWLVATAGGMGFFCRPDLTETTRSGRRFARTKESDELVTMAPADGDTVTAVSGGGKVLTFAAEELPELAGAGRGVILMRLDRDETLVAAVCHPAERPPLALAADGSEHRFTLPEGGHRAQKGRKALKRFKVVDLLAR